MRRSQSSGKKNRAQRQVAIIGANDIGMHVAGSFGRKNENVVLIDERQEFLAELSEEMDVLSLTANPLARETLEMVGIGPGTILITLTEYDELNLLLLFLGQSLGISEGYALVRNLECYRSFVPLFCRFGAKLQAFHLWELVAQEVERRAGFRLKTLYAGHDTQKTLTAMEIFPGNSLCADKNPYFKSINHSNILAILNKGQFTLYEEGLPILPPNTLILSSDEREWSVLTRQLLPLDSSHKVILGGEGVITVFRSHWPNFLSGLACIEKSQEKCWQILKISNELLVLKGDGLDISLLKEAGIEQASLFFAATESDETNLLASLLVKNSGVTTNLTLLHKHQHWGMQKNLPLEGIISIPELVKEYLEAIILQENPTRPPKDNPLSQSFLTIDHLRVQFRKDRLPPGLHLLSRAHNWLPLQEGQEKEGEEILVITY